MPDTATIPFTPVSATWRNEILTFAAHLIPEADRGYAALVAATAKPLLDWASQAPGEDDARQRMRAMRHQHANTPPLLHRSADLPQRWVEVPCLTPAEFLAESAVLYDFITAGEK
jgi:hypothetical protein